MASLNSSDLNALDFFLWYRLKLHVYVTTPQSFQDLSDRFKEECQIITLGRWTLEIGLNIDCTWRQMNIRLNVLGKKKHTSN